MDFARDWWIMKLLSYSWLHSHFPVFCSQGRPECLSGPAHPVLLVIISAVFSKFPTHPTDTKWLPRLARPSARYYYILSPLTLRGGER